MYKQIRCLNSKLTKEEYSVFTISRRKRFYSHIWPDMCIDGILMKTMKAVIGSTHGRRITNSTLTEWVLDASLFLQIHSSSTSQEYFPQPIISTLR